MPLGSLVWTIARIPANSAPQDHGELLLPGSWSSLLPRNSIVIASARPVTDVRLRAQVITPNDTDAQRFTERVSAFLTLFRTIDISLDGGGPDPDVKKAFDSFDVKQEKNEAVLTATVPYAFFKKIVAETPVEFGGESDQARRASNSRSTSQNTRAHSAIARKTTLATPCLIGRVFPVVSVPHQ